MWMTTNGIGDTVNVASLAANYFAAHVHVYMCVINLRFVLLQDQERPQHSRAQRERSELCARIFLFRSRTKEKREKAAFCIIVQVSAFETVLAARAKVGQLASRTRQLIAGGHAPHCTARPRQETQGALRGGK